MTDAQGKDAILAHQYASKARKYRLRWMVALSSLPLFGIITAFGLAPDTDTRQIPVQNIMEQLPLPSDLQITDAQSDNVTYWRDEEIMRGDTASSVLQRLGLSSPQILRFLKSPDAIGALIKIHPGKRVQAAVSGTGKLIWLRHVSTDGTMLEVLPVGDKFSTTAHPVTLVTRTVMKSGIIHGSLFGATDAAGIPDTVATQIADIFSTDIDFHQDLRRNDRFNVVYEVLYHDGQAIMTGRVLAAEFTNAGRNYRAVLSSVSGKDDYYTPEGKPIKKAFLRSPLPFTRISSGFAMRFHPILKKWKQHKGIDYAAPIGTKVMAIADATVDFVGQQRGYGNVIMLKHASNYSSVYGHLSAFAKGLHRGEHVSRGDVIGYVGMTGWATGPHLHYEFRIAGVPVNPLTANIPVAFPIASSLMPRFHQGTQALVDELNLLHQSSVIAMD